jgi:hypothetical protein
MTTEGVACSQSSKQSVRLLAARCARAIRKNPSKDRGRRKHRVPVAPAASCARVESTRVSHHRLTGTPGISCAMVLTVYFALSPVTGLCCHRRQWSYLHQLDASVGASGPHDFAVRKVTLSSAAPPASIASLPYVRDDRDTPLLRGRDAVDVKVIWVKSEPEYFCEEGWTDKWVICPTGSPVRQLHPPPDDAATFA